MKQIICTLLILLYSVNVLGDDIKYLPKDTPAPFAGYLISPDFELKFRLMDKELDYMKKVNEGNLRIIKGQEDSLTIMDQRIVNQHKQIDNLVNSVAREKNDMLSNVGFFLLGSIITGLIGYGIYRGTK